MNVYTSVHRVKSVKLGPIEKGSLETFNRPIRIESDEGSFELILFSDIGAGALLVSVIDGGMVTPSEARRFRDKGIV